MDFYGEKIPHKRNCVCYIYIYIDRYNIVEYREEKLNYNRQHMLWFDLRPWCQNLYMLTSHKIQFK